MLLFKFYIAKIQCNLELCKHFSRYFLQKGDFNYILTLPHIKSSKTLSDFTAQNIFLLKNLSNANIVIFLNLSKCSAKNLRTFV
nr:MAG TPA: hypothetical protein [Caudoviricetes sp.]